MTVDVLQLGNTSNTALEKKITMLLQTSTAVPANHVLKIVDSGGNPRATVVASGDSDNIPVIGVSVTATTAAEQNIVVCMGGIFEAVVQSGITISIGDAVEKSGTTSGRVTTGADEGIFGVALSAGTGDAGGTVTIRGLFARNELF